MTLSGRVNEIKSGQARNSGRTFYKVFVQNRANNSEVTLFAWDFEVIRDVVKGQNYDFDVDYSDREQKFLAINSAQHVVYTDEDRGYPAALDEPTQKSIEPPAPPAIAPQAPKSDYKGSKQDNDLHIIRESALKSAAVFMARSNTEGKYNEDDLIYVASKLEDYIKNGAAL